MTVSRMLKPKPPVLTPEQQARAIDQRNLEAGKGSLKLASLTPPKPKPGGRA